MVGAVPQATIFDFIVALATAVTAGLAVAASVGGLMGRWRRERRIHDAIMGSPGDPEHGVERTPGVLERLTAVERRVAGLDRRRDGP